LDVHYIGNTNFPEYSATVSKRLPPQAEERTFCH
jgi:hypothetical protein